MKQNIILGSVFMMLVLPQLGFGQTAVTSPAAKNNSAVQPNSAPAQENTASALSNQNPNQTTPDFAGHGDRLRQMDENSKAYYAQRAAERGKYLKDHPVSKEKEEADRAYYAQQAAARGAYLKEHPVTPQENAANLARYAQEAAARGAYLRSLQQGN